MGERAALDLSKIMTQYELLGPIGPAMPVLPLEDEKSPLRFQVPVRLGRGPLTWSTCTALLPVEDPVHDVNGYYRELGVHWRATRRELMAAYRAKDGQRSPRLTYVFKQLLNPKVRQAYDRMPKGSTFDDEYTDQDLKRKAHAAAGERRSRGETVTVDQVLDEWGYVILPEDELDSVASVRKDQGHPQDEPWPFSYYAWNTSSYLPDVDRLRRWQELLSTAASRRGVAPKMILGTTSLSDRQFMLEEINGEDVVFFSEGTEPSPSVADAAIENICHISPHLSHLTVESDIS